MVNKEIDLEIELQANRVRELLLQTPVPRAFQNYAKGVSGYRGEADENTPAEDHYYATLSALWAATLAKAITELRGF